MKVRLLYTDPFVDLPPSVENHIIGIKMYDAPIIGEPVRIVDEQDKEIVDSITSESPYILLACFDDEEAFVNFKAKTNYEACVVTLECECNHTGCMLKHYEQTSKRIKLYQKDKELTWHFL